ncbi:HAMP domain-containing histidine kinase [Marinobacter confluentis]|uniref:histidine kinase n=2 Tax=Marinobacter confluentis TaxID=1697557 RepID=A0A4Z1BYG0_9GAMM|nr:HAMP domain-containing histidine kinase [Marinobacter confluentis]
MVALLYGFISFYSLKQYNASVNQEIHRNLASNLVADRNLVSEGALDQAALRDLFALYMAINPSIEIYLLDLDGTILSYSADPAKIKRNNVSLEPIRTLLANPEQYPVLGDDPRSHERQKVFSVTPVPSADQPEGYLYVVLRGEEYDTAETMARGGQLVALSAWALLVALVVVMIAGLLVFRLLTARLTRLTRLVEAFEAGDMSQHPERTWRSQRPVIKDEIDYLGATFDDMAQRIASQIDLLREKDAQRRQLVAQVSHDLRTPLASMQGYIETLKLRRDRLSAEEQASFLQIALQEGQRLSRLVDELFELAALEAREKQPVLEPFPLAELVHDVAHKHIPEAERRSVTLTVSGSRQLPLAFADLSMTERVLDNLIGNAITYTPEGGQITLELGESDGQPEVSVRDSGPGIPAKDLPHIFEPFYQGDGEGNGGHAGLGLAIARRIMSLQGGDIRAENVQEGGACFSIRLPVAASGHH